MQNDFMGLKYVVFSCSSLVDMSSCHFYAKSFNSHVTISYFENAQFGEMYMAEKKACSPTTVTISASLELSFPQVGVWVMERVHYVFPNYFLANSSF